MAREPDYLAEYIDKLLAWDRYGGRHVETKRCPGSERETVRP